MPRTVALQGLTRMQKRNLTFHSLAPRKYQPKPKPKLKGGAKPKPKATRRSSRSPPNTRVKKEVEERDDVVSEPMVTDSPENHPHGEGDLRGVQSRIHRLQMTESWTGLGASEASGSGSPNGPLPPYPVSFNGPIPRSIEDVDTPERLHQRRYCGRLFDGTVKFGKDEDGLQECMLIDLPDLLPLDREKVLKWKASEQQRIREGKPPVDYESDYEGMTDEEKRQVVECCTPADLDGMQVGTIRGVLLVSILLRWSFARTGRSRGMFLTFIVRHRMTVYEDGFVEYVCGGVRFEVTEGTDVIDRQDVYLANMNKKCVDSKGNECDIAVYPMMTVKHRLVCSPIVDDLI